MCMIPSSSFRPQIADNCHSLSCGHPVHEGCFSFASERIEDEGRTSPIQCLTCGRAAIGRPFESESLKQMLVKYEQLMELGGQIIIDKHPSRE